MHRHMISTSRILAGLTAATTALAATPAAEGAFEFLVVHPELRAMNFVIMLAGLTAITFIVVLLACGMRDPIL